MSARRARRLVGLWAANVALVAGAGCGSSPSGGPSGRDGGADSSSPTDGGSKPPGDRGSPGDGDSGSPPPTDGGGGGDAKGDAGSPTFAGLHAVMGSHGRAGSLADKNGKTVVLHGVDEVAILPELGRRAGARLLRVVMVGQQRSAASQQHHADGWLDDELHLRAERRRNALSDLPRVHRDEDRDTCHELHLHSLNWV